ncbi:MAG: methyltransferase [Phyllobacterium sp.]|uniref:methyltransferase n=1 Tax=Phyllobacterium sp. TaxID=1871046 RepID=UPI0030F27079
MRKIGADMSAQSQTPAQLLRRLSLVMRASRALSVAAQLGVADILASGEIAAAAGVDGATLRRLLRALVAFGVFEEEAPDRFRLNPAGELLRRDIAGSQRAGVLFTAGDMRWQLWLDLLECVRTGQAAVERAFGKTLFERNAQNTEESELFNQAMASYSAALSAPIVAAYDFGSFGCVADIGGGTGRLLADILVANPIARGVLFDLPNVVAAAPPLLAASGVAERCEVVAGSFFDDVPDGADAYVLRAVIHDWDDARAAAILSNCRRAMTSAGTLVIAERVMPEKAEQGRAEDAYLLDLEMLVNTPGGRERTEAEFQAILRTAGFGPARVITTAAPVSILDARPA